MKLFKKKPVEKPQPVLAKIHNFEPVEPPPIYMDPEEAKQREGETLDEYHKRVPLQFRPIEKVTLSYLGKPIV